MRTRSVLLMLLVLAAAAANAGCVSNMGELKEAMGVRDPPPVYEAPVARAQANATAVLAGVPVRLSSDGSRDPQGLPLTFRWSFSAQDEVAAASAEPEKEGAVVTHAFPAAGEWRATLNVTNGAGLSDEATVILQVAAGNRPPSAVIAITDSKGSAVASAEMGVAVSFDASASFDPDGVIAQFAWDFGDGATSLDEKVSRAFHAPGLYNVKLRVTDAEGLTSTSSRLIAVGATFTFDGAFGATDGAPRAHAFRLAEGAAELRATLTFPAGLGGNDLALVLKDASGAEVGRTTATTEPGAQGVQTRELVVAGEALRSFVPGEWRAEVLKEKGVQLDYTLVVRESF